VGRFRVEYRVLKGPVPDLKGLGVEVEWVVARLEERGTRDCGGTPEEGGEVELDLPDNDDVNNSVMREYNGVRVHAVYLRIQSILTSSESGVA